MSDLASPAPVVNPVRGPAWRGFALVAVLLAAATLASTVLDGQVSLTSQAMVYVLAVVLAAYTLDWLASVVCAIGAVIALNFFFVPPRWTFQVENREHLIALAAMLVVALVISHLAASLRRETAIAQRNEQRARQLQQLASALAQAPSSTDMAALGRQALSDAFAGPSLLAITNEQGELQAPADLPDGVADGMRQCMLDAAVLGPGTGRWPGLNAWYLPLLDGGRTSGAACVQNVRAADHAGRAHAQALCTLLAQALWRLRLAAAAQAAQGEVQRQQLQSTLLAAISHDFRTPLAAVVGAASSLQTQRDKLSNVEQDRLLAHIISEAHYLATVTDNTLQLVRLTNTTQALQRDWEAMEEIVGAVLARVRQRDPARRIKSKLAPGLPLVRADPVLLAQLLENLLDNALKYSTAGIELSAATQDGQLLLRVQDHGPGIAPEHLPYIFEPYARGDQTGLHGAGLGLAVCRAIATAHGGTLTLSQPEAGGCTFTLALPLEVQQQAPLEALA